MNEAENDQYPVCNIVQRDFSKVILQHCAWLSDQTNQTSSSSMRFGGSFEPNRTTGAPNLYVSRHHRKKYVLIVEKFGFGEISSSSGSVRQNPKVRRPFIAKKKREKKTKQLFDQRYEIRILI